MIIASDIILKANQHVLIVKLVRLVRNKKSRRNKMEEETQHIIHNNSEELPALMVTKRETCAGSILKEVSYQLKSHSLMECLLALELLDEDIIKNQKEFTKVKKKLK